MDSKARFIGAISGVRGGKTTIGAIWLCNRIYQDYQKGVTGDYLIAAPTSKILDQAALPKFKEIFPKDWGEWREQPKSYFQLKWTKKDPDGKDTGEPCRIFVRSLDDPNAIEGMECLAIWADEVGLMKDQAWINFQSRTSITQGPVLMTGTPYSMNWFYRDVYQSWKDGNKDFDVVQWRSMDNPSFREEEYERAKKTMPKVLFDRTYGGQFTRLEGLVYPEFDEDELLVDPFEIPAVGLVFAGLDFGYNNPNAIVYIWEDPKTKIYYVFREFYQNKVLLKDLAASINHHQPSYVLADTQSAQLIAELRRFHGVRQIREADKVKEAGIERIRNLLIEKRLKFFRNRTQNLVEEFKTYHYQAPKADGTSSEKIVDKHNHALDALRYAFSRPLQGLYVNRVKRDFKSILKRRGERLTPSDPLTGY